MNQSLLTQFGTPIERTEQAIEAFKVGKGVIVVDDENRENEGDIIFAAQHLTVEQTAQLIRDCSGIVCLCLPERKLEELGLPMMVENNTSAYGTGFTVTIEAAVGVTTGVSAADRTTTIKAAIADGAKPSDLNRPGHVFPLRAKDGGVLVRDGHTEASVDIARMAELKPYGVLCEITNPDGTMTRLPGLVTYAKDHDMTLVSINDIIEYRKTTGK
ncbi:MAG: 3,4-dihydroxy-2-butanone 4-phosphate synthase [Massilibacillus sp.]|jgi:3,4-dihydroxy 2-butanone 4-phosphate synthase|nr:3,4-dihydroxy-2-butanone 4-phosphate synthase [Massilibacillus sp.]